MKIEDVMVDFIHSLENARLEVFFSALATNPR
jgi:hypothetical protein